LVLIVFAAGQYRPCDTSQFVGDRDHDFIPWRTLCKPMHPLAETSSIVLNAQQYGTSTVDQHAPQIMVATLADAKQLLLSSGLVLSWHNANPGREVTPTPKG